MSYLIPQGRPFGYKKKSMEMVRPPVPKAHLPLAKSSAQVSNGTHGAVTGIALGEYAHKKGGSGTVHIKMKGSKVRHT